MDLDVSTIRARLDHPVVDADGHVVEALPVLVDHIARAAGDDVARRFVDATPAFAARHAYLLARSDAGGRVPQRGVPMTPWWALPTTARDRATGFLPGLLHERLDEIGLDYSILYPSAALACIGHPDAAIRTGACRGLNTYLAELLDGYGDRLDRGGGHPHHHAGGGARRARPRRAVLGFKVVMLNDLVVRPAADGVPPRLDVLALDSEHDYDPVWARCVELGVAVTVHSPAQGHGLRTSSSRYMYNHIGNFGAAGDAFAKAVVFGGVAHRFPTLTFAFLEGGVAWGVQLLCDLVDRWHKRGGPHISQYDPSRLDRAEWDALLDRYGGDRFADPAVRAAMAAQSDSPPVELDDFRDAGVSDEGDLVRQFDRFYFGCEADDATISWAFARHVNPHGTELRPILGSDLGHWDVADMTDVLPEAYELVADGLLDAAQFRALTCDNAIRLHGAMNPSFFDGTVVEAYARQLLAVESAAAATPAG